MFNVRKYTSIQQTQTFEKHVGSENVFQVVSRRPSPRWTAFDSRPLHVGSVFLRRLRFSLSLLFRQWSTLAYSSPVLYNVRKL
jgi:hypothetical protein